MTFSIVARDPQTGALGVATATAGPAVGALVPHGVANVGAIATQAMTNPYLAFDGLDMLSGGMAAWDALEAALARDPTPERRQLIIVDALGRTAAWTGATCQAVAGHRQGDGFAIAGNLVAAEAVFDAMTTAFEGSLGTERLSDRLLATLAAGAAAGGDSRGIGSAAIKVYHRERYPQVDIRVDHSTATMADLSAMHAEAVAGDYATFFDQVHRRS